MFGLDTQSQLQNVMFLQLVAGGQLLLFVTRYRALVLPAAIPGSAALRCDRRHPDIRGADVRLRLAGAGRSPGRLSAGLGLQDRLDVHPGRVGWPPRARGFPYLPPPASRGPSSPSRCSRTCRPPVRPPNRTFEEKPWTTANSLRSNRVPRLGSAMLTLPRKGKHASHEEALPEIRKHVAHMDHSSTCSTRTARIRCSWCCRPWTPPARTAPSATCLAV